MRSRRSRALTALATLAIFGAALSACGLSTPTVDGCTIENGAHCENANLTGADLANHHLINADLAGATLTHANLTRTILSSANLKGADLQGAVVMYANVSYADLQDANLTNADLSYVDLAHANLTGANLTGATLYEATMTGVDLAGANLTNTNLSGPPARCRLHRDDVGKYKVPQRDEQRQARRHLRQPTRVGSPAARTDRCTRAPFRTLDA